MPTSAASLRRHQPSASYAISPPILAWLCGLFALLPLSACNSYSVQQTALVPAAIAPPIPARNPGGELALVGSYITGAREHDMLKSSSVWVSRGYGLGTLEYTRPGAGFRFTGFYGPSQGALRGPGVVLSRPPGSIHGGGVGITFRAFRDSPVQRLHFAFDTALVIAPSYVRARCIDCSPSESTRTRLDRSATLMPTFSVHYRRDLIAQLTFITTLAFQTLVTNDENVVGQSRPGRSKVRMGAFHTLFNVGLEVHALRWLSIAPLVGIIAPPSPMLYLPDVSLMFRVHVPERSSRDANASSTAWRR